MPKRPNPFLDRRLTEPTRRPDATLIATTGPNNERLTIVQPRNGGRRRVIPTASIPAPLNSAGALIDGKLPK